MNDPVIAHEGAEVHVGLKPVRIVKMFGPTIFADLEVVADLTREAWVIRRAGVEWVMVPAQLDSDFQEDGPQ